MSGTRTKTYATKVVENCGLCPCSSVYQDEDGFFDYAQCDLSDHEHELTERQMGGTEPSPDWCPLRGGDVMLTRDS